jgi:predicted transcriptional regulator
MIDSISEQLEREMACEALLSCFYSHTELDKECYQQIASSSEPLTVDDVAEKISCGRSTVYRSIQRLLRTGLIEEEQINYDDGGYYHQYSVTDPKEAASEMYRTLSNWYVKMDQLISEFDEIYDKNE